MTDLLYLALTVAIFAIMIAFGHACDALGRAHSASTEQR